MEAFITVLNLIVAGICLYLFVAHVRHSGHICLLSIFLFIAGAANLIVALN